MLFFGEQTLIRYGRVDVERQRPSARSSLGVGARRGLLEALGVGEEDLDAVGAQRGGVVERVLGRDVGADVGLGPAPSGEDSSRLRRAEASSLHCLG